MLVCSCLFFGFMFMLGVRVSRWCICFLVCFCCVVWLSCVLYICLLVVISVRWFFVIFGSVVGDFGVICGWEWGC